MEIQGHLQLPDYIMLAGYFVLMIGIGAYFYRYMRGMKDYFTGHNAIPWWLSGVSFYMTSFSVSAFVFYPSLCDRYGWTGVTMLWVAVPATFFSAAFFAKRWRRARIDSPVEYIENRYSPALRQIFAWQGIPVGMIDNGIRLYATSKFISVCSGLEVGYCIVATGGIMLLYTAMGGVWAVSVTDFVQFVVLSAGILIVLPTSVMKAGGFENIFQNSPDGFFRLTAPGYEWSYVIPLVGMYALAWSSTRWSLIQRYYCVPTEKDALKVGGLVMALYVVGPPLMFFPAIAARQFIPTLVDAGDVYPALCVQLLPAGMLGLAMAAMFAATMSTLSGEYNACASVLTNDVYRRLIRSHAGPRELVFVGRMMTLLVGIIGLATAFIINRASKAEGLFDIMVTLFSIAAPPVAIPMLLGLISKKMTNRGAIAGFLCGTALGVALFAIPRIAALFGLAWSDEVTIAGLALKMETVQILGTSLVTFVVMILVSWRTPVAPDAAVRIEAFMQRLRTPIGALPEDRPGDQPPPPSPFRVVGVSVLAIGLLMLAIGPWVGGGMALALDAVLGGLLALVGGLMVWSGWRATVIRTR